MMAVDYYTTGYSAFLSGTMNDQQVKQQHPLFRAGYNAAKKQAEQKTKTISDVRVQKVERAEKKPYEIKWKDINTVMSFVPWNILSRKPELEVLYCDLPQRGKEIRRDQVLWRYHRHGASVLGSTAGTWLQRGHPEPR